MVVGVIQLVKNRAGLLDCLPKANTAAVELGVSECHVNPRFHTSSIVENLVLTWKDTRPAGSRERDIKCQSVCVLLLCRF